MEKSLSSTGRCVGPRRPGDDRRLFDALMDALCTIPRESRQAISAEIGKEMQDLEKHPENEARIARKALVVAILANLNVIERLDQEIADSAPANLIVLKGKKGPAGVGAA